MAYATRGRLAPDGRNAILVAHGYTSGPETIAPGTHAIDGSLAQLIGPGRAIDTDRFFVVCPNALGSSFGSTNAASTDPGTGRPWGSAFPDITVADIVAGQRALMEHLGVRHLAAVVGASFGGLQALQWAVDYPDWIDCVVPAICAPRMPGVDVPALERDLAALPGWNGGDYYDEAEGLVPALVRRRIGALKAFGADAVLARELADPEARDKELNRLARAWAMKFDANSLLILFRAMAAFDVTARLSCIRAPVLYVLSRTDRLVPPSVAPDVMAQFRAAGVQAQYMEIDSEDGHCAAGSEAHRWAEDLRAFIARTQAQGIAKRRAHPA